MLVIQVIGAPKDTELRTRLEEKIIEVVINFPRIMNLSEKNLLIFFFSGHDEIGSSKSIKAKVTDLSLVLMLTNKKELLSLVCQQVKRAFPKYLIKGEVHFREFV